MSGAEPEFTIYVPAWGVARERVGTVEPEETRALLYAALNLVENGWPALRDLQRWVSGTGSRRVRKTMTEAS